MDNTETTRGAWDRALRWTRERLTLPLVRTKLGLVAGMLNMRPSLRHHLTDTLPTGEEVIFEARMQWTTWDRQKGVHAVFGGGRMRVGFGTLSDPDVTFRCKRLEDMRRFFATGADTLDMIISNDVAIEGNMSVLAKFGHMAASVQQAGERLPLHPRWETSSWPDRHQDLEAFPAGVPCRDLPEGEVTQLSDPHLADVTLDDMPRIKQQLWAYRTTLARWCPERALNLTEFLRGPDGGGFLDGSEGPDGGAHGPGGADGADGVDGADGAGGADGAVLRQGRAVAHMLRCKQPVIHEDDILAGTTTSKRIGVPLYPELGATWGWSELLTTQARERNPYLITDEEVDLLDRQVFPFWLHHNVRQFAYEHGEDPSLLDLDARFALYFMWKTQAISHTVIDFPQVLGRGLLEIQQEARTRAHEGTCDGEARELYRAMDVALDGVMEYSRCLATHARELADAASGDRRVELLDMARICQRVPAHPAQTLHEAVQAIWILMVSLHQESFNAAMVVGRLDVWLEPYFQRHMEGAVEPAQRRRRELRALELCCALMLKLTDHLPFVESAGNRIFSGSSGNQVITLGGVDADGRSAVCDMTWIWLKATEVLRLRDPNVNARFAPGVNSDAYLWRLCEVNLLTGATPSLHNDDAVIPAMEAQGFSLEHARDWTATGCVEPTSCGRHLGHTNSMMFNMVAALEMALHDGVHPLIAEQVGPRTGDPATFETYEQLLAAFETQLCWLIDRAAAANNMLGRTHQRVKPTPLMSALFDGPMESGRDLLRGGARYNSSGTAMVGLTDVVDSLAAVKTLVFETQRADMATLLEALEADFVGHEELHAELLHRVPRFGQAPLLHPGAGGAGEDRRADLPGQIARHLMALIFDRYQSQEHYRGGRYVPGYWSMSYHVAFGDLSGALPSGRRRGQSFTPGLTPSLLSGAPLTEQLRAVASLDAQKMPNNIAFNVKVVPGPDDSHQQVVDRMAAYLAAYFEMGGMQIQFNCVGSDTLRRAMEHPDEHRDLLVRISGYNVYFVDLTPEAQLEVVERMEHSLA